MKTMLMNLKILLPHKVFAEVDNVSNIQVETSEGLFGLLPNRLDCMAIIVQGIFTYEAKAGGKKYLALDEGILVKAGPMVLVSVRNAIGRGDLGQLRESVEKEFRNLDEKEKNIRQVMLKLETGFIHEFEKLRKG